MDYEQVQQVCASACYFYTENKEQCMLPMLSTNYIININNNFAKIQMQQVYLNPFDKPLQIHYTIPTDPSYSISGLKVLYQQAEVIGTVVQKQKAKLQYKKMVQKGEVAVMANYYKSQVSILKIRIGNIGASQKITIKLDLDGPLQCQTSNQWTLRIPSHIGPRYTCFKDLLPKLYNKYLKNVQSKQVIMAYLNPNIQWGFNIKLQCSDRIKKWNCQTHDLKLKQITPQSYQFYLQNKELPQIDLEFTYQKQDQTKPLCTYGRNCMCLTFYLPQQENQNKVNRQFIFLLDRSGSMSGTSINSAKQALILYLKSLPQNSKFNIISFGSNFEKMYQQSQFYTQQIVKKTVQMISKFQANFGGTQINQPLTNILNNQKYQQQYQRHIILLTDGQVSNTQAVIQTIRKIRQKSIGFTHTIGIGSGFSMQLIKKGAQAGQGQYVVILNSSSISKKIIDLLETLIKPKLTNFKIKYNTDLFQINQFKIPQKLIKSRPNNIYLAYNPKAGVLQEAVSSLQNYLEIEYLDEQKNQNIQYKIPLKPTHIFDDLDKFYTKLKIQDLMQFSSNQNKQKAIKLSVQNGVLCKFTALLCKVKQNQSATKQKSSYYIKLKSSLEGQSQLSSKPRFGDVNVKTLTGKTLTFSTNLYITGEELKQMVYQAEGIPVDQQRMIFVGRQIENQRTLSEMGIEHQSTVHLVLRLRGDGGSSGTRSNLFNLSLILYQTRIIVRQPQITPQSSISQLQKQINLQFPTIKDIKYSLKFNQKTLDQSKNLSDYPQINSGCSLQITGIPIYLHNVDELIKLMKVNGSWQFSLQILQALNLQQDYGKRLKNHKQNQQKAMTQTIIQYLKKTYSNRKDQFKLIYKKAKQFISK